MYFRGVLKSPGKSFSNFFPGGRVWDHKTVHVSAPCALNSALCLRLTPSFSHESDINQSDTAKQSVTQPYRNCHTDQSETTNRFYAETEVQQLRFQRERRFCHDQTQTRFANRSRKGSETTTTTAGKNKTQCTRGVTMESLQLLRSWGVHGKL